MADHSTFEDHWEVSVIPNLSMLELAQREGIEDENLHCLVVTGTEGGDRAALPFVSRETELLESVIPSKGLTKLQGRQTDLAMVLKELPGASVLHFASHGRFDPDCPERSGIQLAGNQWLTVSRLNSTADSRLKARLAYLSCCETRILGKSSLPDEFVGLLPALLQCGVRASIGALWPVCDDSAMLMSWRFYKEYLDEGGNERCHPALALARAKRWLSAADLATLIKEGLISAREGVAFAESRFGCVRRRRFDGSMVFSQDLDQICETEESVVSSIGKLKIYSSPADWAAYVVVGI